MKLKRASRILLASVLACSMIVVPVSAAPEDETSDSASLEEQKAEKESEVSELQAQLTELMSKINELETQLVAKGQEITQAQEDLAVAEEKEEEQYEDLKLRIKYMYEAGDSSAMERIFSSGSIAEMLTQAEYVEKVHLYDREQLQIYQDTVQEVSDLKDTLESDMASMQSLEDEYEAQSEELSNTIAGKSAEIEGLDAMIQEAAAAALAAQAEEEEAAASASSSSNNGSSYSYTSAAPSYNVVTGNAIVDRAYSWVGNAEYVWGACSPGAFDCSGFVSYCLTGQYVRLGTTATFLTWPQVSDPQPGDVCVSSSHCGIYIGGGQMIHCSTYGVGVIIGPVQSDMIYVRYPG